MSKTIDFYFDFSSPYGYFSSTKIEDLATRCEAQVKWRPYLMGVVMKITQRKPLVQIPMINDYSSLDLHRVARFENIEFKLPTPFPIATVAACRAYYWLVETDPLLAKSAAKVIFDAYFVKNRNIAQKGVIADLLTELGLSQNEVADALIDPAVKAKLRTATNQAIETGVFGSPFFIVDGEPFWGHDRLSHLESWIKNGGW